jgi:ABC-2 type transport system permease protein
MAGALTVARKEFLDILSDRKFLLVYGAFVVMVMSAALVGANQFRSGIFSYLGQAGLPHAGSVGMDLSALPYVLGEMVKNVSIIGGMLAVIISFDTVNKERYTGSLNVLLSYPIYRDQILVGKYVGGFATVVLAAFSALSAGMGLFIGVTGMPINRAIVARLLAFTGITVVYMAVFFGVGLFFSILLDDTTSSLLGSVSVWVVSLFLLTALGGLAASLDEPPEFNVFETNATTGLGANVNMTGGGNLITIVSSPDDAALGPGHMAREVLYFVSPSMSFETSVNEILETTSFDFTGGQSITVPTTLSESLARAAPNVIYLSALLVGFAAASYVSFSRKEIT